MKLEYLNRFVAAGLGVSLISASLARDEVRAAKMKLIEMSEVDLWRELGLVYCRDRTLLHSAHTAMKHKAAK
jgi:DNA-binding transcriptional LysR family regulator